MLVQPIIVRELRVQARSRASYWLRIVAGGTAAFTLAGALLIEQELAFIRGPNRGPWLFALIHTSISLVLAVVCPLMTADTLARERREGTLGLLLLTPLTPLAIIMGKMTVHLLRALALWLAVLPVLVVPVLLGGVSVVDVGFALGLELGVVLGGLAAGLLASSFTERWGTAMGLAALFAVLIGESLAVLSFLGFLPFMWYNKALRHWTTLVLVATVLPWFVGSGLIENGFAQILARNAGWMANGILAGLAAAILGSAGAFVTALCVAAYRVRHLNRSRVPTTSQIRRRRFWFKPRFGDRHRRRRRARLQRDPMLWLYTTESSVRWGRWAWCGLVLLVWGGIAIAGLKDPDTEPWVFGVQIGLVIISIFVASAGFLRDIEEGRLELLLVTALPPVSIVRARVVTLWSAFLPAMLISTGLTIGWMTRHGETIDRSLLLIAIWSSFLAAPFVASRMAVRRLSPPVAWLWTIGFVVLLPILFGGLAALATEPSSGRPAWNSSTRFVLSFVILQTFEAGFCAWAAVTDLATRRFQLRPLQRVAR